eukprot:3782119-Pyramimonas_sp.AAC.1
MVVASSPIGLSVQDSQPNHEKPVGESRKEAFQRQRRISRQQVFISRPNKQMSGGESTHRLFLRMRHGLSVLMLEAFRSRLRPF